MTCVGPRDARRGDRPRVLHESVGSTTRVAVYDQVPPCSVPLLEATSRSSPALTAETPAFSPASATLSAEVELLSRPKAYSFEVTSITALIEVIPSTSTIRSAQISTTPSDSARRCRSERKPRRSWRSIRICVFCRASRSAPRALDRGNEHRLAATDARSISRRFHLPARLTRVLAQEEGFTLVELLVVILLMGIILAPLIDSMVSALNAQAQQTNVVSAQEQARLAMERMRKDIHCAHSVARQPRTTTAATPSCSRRPT